MTQSSDEIDCERNTSIETYLVQLGNRRDEQTGAINLPIYMSTTFSHPELGQSTGYDYCRTQNPTREALEIGLAKLENGVAGFATSSGMSAIQLSLSIFASGSHIVASRDLYGGSYRYFKDLEEKGQFSFSYCDTEEQMIQAIQSNTVALYIETPTNPLMNEVSLQQLSKIAHEKNLVLIVDNTFLTPMIQQPLVEGADVVIHSATKYLAGHNDVLAGALVTNKPELAEKYGYQLNTTGAVLPAFESWLVVRGLKTLPIRMRQHEINAKQVVNYLKTQDLVTDIYYAGRGGMVSFKLERSEQVKPFLSALQLITFAESLGGVESLITYPTTQTHADIPEEERIAYGLTDNLLRLSVGIELVEDIINDLNQAFVAIKQ